ncbi:arginine--tRNA ligase [Candidatus Woesearchaeota archaeon]|nr:arginine--tRNA ligase [Candidatus Woesearchaeota archaeon]
MEQFRKAVEEILKKEVKGAIALEIPQNPAMGDFAFPCFGLAKELKKNPAAIAQELAGKLNPKAPIQKIEAKGPYVNFFIVKENMAEAILHAVTKENGTYGATKGKKEKVLLEFPSPNTNKPLHLGHLRNIFLGMSISNILEFLGNRVYRVNLNNDRGIHICKSMLAYQKFGKGREPDKKSDHFVGDFYVLYNQKLKEMPALEQEAQSMLRKWEEGDKEVRALWKQMNQWALQGFEMTYCRLGMVFDKTYNESAFFDKAKVMVEEGLKKGVFERQEDGSVLAPLEQYGLPNKVVLRKDQTSIYITQDMYLAKKKFEDFKIDRSIYLVGSEQNLHFQQLFKILELLGYPWAKQCLHLSYGMVYLPQGRMKSREGRVVDADDLLEEMEKLAAAEIRKRHPELKEKEVKERAKQIGHGALRFFILKVDAQKDMVYNPEESIAFEGETGPYVQYAHARICSILKKHGKKIPEKGDFSLLNSPEEKQLIKALATFPETVHAAAMHYRPSLLCQYLISLAQACNEFYHQHPILQAEEKRRDARLLLISCIRQVLENGLSLLGIEAPGEM